LAIVVTVTAIKNGYKLLVLDDTEERKTVYIDNVTGVKPIHVDLGYATTTYKTQGREFPYIIFWNRTNPQEHWTRAHAYVAVSRGKQRVWIMGTPQEFYTVCDQVEPRRRTIFRHMLRTAFPAPEATESGEVEPLEDPATLVELPRDGKPCVWTLADVVREMKSDQKC
jgi:hypothetical protein